MRRQPPQPMKSLTPSNGRINEPGGVVSSVRRGNGRAAVRCCVLLPRLPCVSSPRRDSSGKVPWWLLSTTGTSSAGAHCCGCLRGVVRATLQRATGRRGIPYLRSVLRACGVGNVARKSPGLEGGHTVTLAGCSLQSPLTSYNEDTKKTRWPEVGRITVALECGGGLSVWLWSPGYGAARLQAPEVRHTQLPPPCYAGAQSRCRLCEARAVGSSPSQKGGGR